MLNLISKYISDFYYENITYYLPCLKRFNIYIEQQNIFIKFANNYYKLNLLNSDNCDILDIGGNQGNIITIFKKFKSYTCVDPLGISRNKNIINIKQKFELFNTDKKYDIIISYAVHNYIKLEPINYFKKINNLLKKNGIICFKSHKLPDNKFNEIKLIFNKFYKVIYKTSYKYLCIQRELIYYQKI